MEIKFEFKRLDHEGIQSSLAELNTLINEGYRFKLSGLLADKPVFRVGTPSFSLVKEDIVEESKPQPKKK